MSAFLSSTASRIWYWISGSDALHGPMEEEEAERIDWFRMIPYLGVHLACLGVLWVGVSWVAVVAAFVFYVVRMFFITAFYHRYFSHRTFKTSRVLQFLMGVLGCTAGQRGPVWWAGHHRHHHNYSDQQPDHHSPRRRGFLWSHTLWFMTKDNYSTPRHYVPDWLRYRELQWLDRLDWLPLVCYAGMTFFAGQALGTWWPETGTSGLQMLVWGFFVSTVLLYHGTYTINSLAHRFGTFRFRTGDDSRNNWWLAILTLGEGWHNNHHYYPSSARQGFYWWEIDLTFYVLKLMEMIGLIRDIRPVPAKVLTRSIDRGE